MQVTYQGQTLKIDLAATYRECRSRIIEKTKIGERTIWKIEYKDEDQQLCDVDSDDTYTTMLEEYEAKQRPPHLYIKVDPASCSVSEIKEKQIHQSDSSLEVQHDVVNNVQANNQEPVEKDKSQQSNDQDKEEKEEGGLSGEEPEEAEDNDQDEEVENQKEEQEADNEGSNLDVDEDEEEVQEPQKNESESNKSDDNEQPQEGESSLEEGQDSPQEQEDDKQQENKQAPSSNPKEDAKKEEATEKNQQANQSTITNLHRLEQKDKVAPPNNKETSVQTQQAQQDNNGEQESDIQPQQGQVQSPLESEHPSEQNEAIAKEVIEEPVKPAAAEPSPRQQIKDEQDHEARQDKVLPQAKPIKTQHKKSSIKQQEPQIIEVLPRQYQHYQLVCSFCRSETQHLQYLCGFHNILTCEQCEENWTIVSKKKRVGSKIRQANPRRTGLKPCSFCGEADGLSRLNTFDISMCAGCDTKWEFLPSRRHLWTQEY